MTQRLFGVACALALAMVLAIPESAVAAPEDGGSMYGREVTAYHSPSRQVSRSGKKVRQARASKKTKVAKTKGKSREKSVSLAVADVAVADLGLVAEARRHIGTNPTGWRSLWCGRFVAMIAPAAARRVKNPNMARDWARGKLKKVSKPQIGAIAVLTRDGGGHIGVVSGVKKNGDPIVISGNNKGRLVGESVYPRSRVIAYVLPSA